MSVGGKGEEMEERTGTERAGVRRKTSN